MGRKWSADKLKNHKGMTGKSHGIEARLAVSNAQKNRKHQPHEGFQKGHGAVAGTEKTRFKKGLIPWNKGKGTGRDPFKPRYAVYKSNAKKRGFIFDITLIEFKQHLSGECFYCFERATGIDRVDNSLGYIEGNMVPCCSICNHMKWILSREQFIEKCMEIITKANEII